MRRKIPYVPYGDEVAKKYKRLKDLSMEDVDAYWVNDGTKVLLIVLYCLLNVIVIVERFIWYYFIKTDAFEILGWGVIAARCSAAALKLNCAAVLVPVLRNFLSYIRGTFLGTYLPIDKALFFHKKIAWLICIFTAIHITAHYANYNTIQRTDIATVKQLLHNYEGDSVPTAWQLGWGTIAGITGHIAVFIQILIYTSAVESMRRPNFEAFWYSHHLFILFYILLAIHGAGMILEPPTFGLWVLGPVLAYLIERIERVIRGHRNTMVLKAIQHPSQVIELQMRKGGFKFKAGQYLFLNCPYLASHEWHPFTISSGTEDSYVGLHIRVAGDWTARLQQMLNPDGRLGIVGEDLCYAPDSSPIFRIDGPLGAASEDIFLYETVILIGTGIGVTPFASILKTIKAHIEGSKNEEEEKEKEGKEERRTRSYEERDNDERENNLNGEGEATLRASPIKKVYFYWIVRESSCFEWLFDVLSSLEAENVNNFLDIHAYLTAAKSQQEAIQRIHTRPLSVMGLESIGEGRRDPITGLLAGTHYGRPDFEDIFHEKALAHPMEDVGVFYCGPPSLSRQLHKLCRRFTKETHTSFHYHKENF